MSAPNNEVMASQLEETLQYCGFSINGDHFAVSVNCVQEVIKPLQVTPVPLAPKEVRGLINLRGQIVTLINLRSVLGIEGPEDDQYMNVILKINDQLVGALMVDEILDVTELSSTSFENTPPTLPNNIKPIVAGVHKLESGLLTVVDPEKIIDVVKREPAA